MTRYERHYGNKAIAVKDLSLTEIAKLIRADIKAAKVARTLPADLKVSVRTEYFSGGGSIDLNITAGLEGMQVHDPERLHAEVNQPNDWREWPRQLYTPEYQRVKDILKAISDAYNHDGSDSMTDYFDVRFYGDVGMHWEYSRAVRAREVATLSVIPFRVSPN